MARKPVKKFSWRDRLEKAEAPKLVPIPPRWRKRYGEGTMLIPRLRDVEALIRRVPKGKLLTLSELRARLAVDDKATMTCPVTTGICLRLIADAPRSGDATPYWRIVRDDGSLLISLPGGAKKQGELLLDEGHLVKGAQGKKLPRVAAYEWQLFKL
jgi:alkylated DNA nucleotide flippase Atl1